MGSESWTALKQSSSNLSMKSWDFKKVLQENVAYEYLKS